MGKKDLSDHISNVLLILEGYEMQLINQGINSKNINFKNQLAKATKVEILQHARYLISEAKKLKREDKHYYASLNQKLGAVQTCLSFAGEVSILDTMHHNKKW